MLPRLRVLLAMGLGALSLGAGAQLHDWTVTRIGPFGNPAYINGLNNSGQAMLSTSFNGSTFLYSLATGALHDIGSLGGGGAFGTDISDNGHVVGQSLLAGDAKQQAFVYQNGSMRGIGLPNETGSVAIGVNSSGHALAYSFGADGRTSTVIAAPSGPPTIISLPGQNANPLRINDRGQVLFYTAGSRRARSFLYDNGTITDIGSLGGTVTLASAINEAGQVVGFSRSADGVDHPFLYSNGKMTAIGNLSRGSALDINDRGQVLVADHGGSAYIYENGQLRKIPGFGGDSNTPMALNELGQVLGFATRAENPFSDGELYFYSDGVTTSLDRWLLGKLAPPDDLLSIGAQGVFLNDLGQIGFDAQLRSGQAALILTPIPEPSTYALMLAGLGTLAYIARRRRKALAQATGFAGQDVRRNR